MEHLGPISVNGSRSGSVGASSTPQGSPRMVRSWSRGKLNRRSADMDSDSAGMMEGGREEGGRRGEGRGREGALLSLMT